MKALQELVPNSNKTDKASMLDEIIDYVKFLQLQVKVSSEMPCVAHVDECLCISRLLPAVTEQYRN